jgi:hypothetical protein
MARIVSVSTHIGQLRVLAWYLDEGWTLASPSIRGVPVQEIVAVHF